MRPFAAKLKTGQQFLGIGLSDADLAGLKAGNPVILDLELVGVGLWVRQTDGSRTFLQPRDSHILIMAGDEAEDIGDLLRVKLPSLKKKKKKKKP